MAPEAPGNLVVIELRWQDGELTGCVERVEYNPEYEARLEEAGSWVYVLWNETPEGEHYSPLGGGVVHVKQPPPEGYRITPKSPTGLDSLGGGRYAYSHPALGEGLMFVLIFPEGYTLANSQPMPRNAKIFEERRLAVYWKPEGKYGVQVTVTWEIRPFTGDLRAERDRITAAIHESANVPSNPGVIVDDPPTREPVPTSLQSAVLQIVLHPKIPRWMQIVIILIVGLAFVIFAIWATLQG